MKKSIGYIELAVVLILLVIIVRVWTYKKPDNKSHTQSVQPTYNMDADSLGVVTELPLTCEPYVKTSTLLARNITAILTQPARFEFRIKIYPGDEKVENSSLDRAVIGLCMHEFGYDKNRNFELLKFTKNNKILLNKNMYLSKDFSEKNYSPNTWYGVRFEYIEPDTFENDTLKLWYLIEDKDGKTIAEESFAVPNGDWSLHFFDTIYVKTSEETIWDEPELYDLRDLIYIGDEKE